MLYDTIIVGGGAAGLTAALYASRRALKTIIITEDVGGQAAVTPDIENYPGVPFIDGVHLMQTFLQQAEHYGARLEFAEVTGIKKQRSNFVVFAGQQQYEGKTIILAFGLSRRHLGIPGEERLFGRGVSYCATCDAPLYRNKTVAVVGFGTAAYDAALLLSKLARQVYLISKQPELVEAGATVQSIKQAEMITVISDTALQEIKGEDRVTNVVIHPLQRPKEIRTIAVDGVFIEAGFQVKSDIISDLIELDERQQIIVSRDCATSLPGVFAAGDVTDIPYKQVVISAGEGAKAALQAAQYLSQRSSASVGIDWGSQK